MIKNNTDRLEAIVEDLLQLARIEKEKDIGEDQLEKVGVLDMIESAKEAVSEKARIKDISIQVRGEENLTVHVNPRLMEQAFLNLLDNAIQYAEPGTSVNIDLEKLDSLVLIHFKDQGPGIAKEHLPRLFERFYRVDKARSRKLGGTGLGLAIVKHIVGAHGGRVTVESTMRQGSLFTIHLPA
ncbi:MAG: ATP-binding protein, partial [Pseudomonadota bacterium]